MAKQINARVLQKHDTAENFEKATGFTPMLGELIIYDPDDSHSYERFKVGNNEDIVHELPFWDEVVELITESDIDTICATTYNNAYVGTDIPDSSVGQDGDVYIVTGGES